MLLNFNMQNKSLEHLVKLFCSKVRGGTWDCSFVVSTQVMSLVEVQTTLWITGPCYCSVTQSYPTLCNPMECKGPLSLTISQSLPKFMSIATVMPSSHLILWCPLLFLPSIFPSIKDFSNDSTVHIRWPNTGASSSASVLPVNIHGWFPLRLTNLIETILKSLIKRYEIWENMDI